MLRGEFGVFNGDNLEYLEPIFEFASSICLDLYKMRAVNK